MIAAAHTQCEVGSYYLVPCLLLSDRAAWAAFVPSSGWVPVLGPLHEDAELLSFPHDHYHIDWRFIPTAQFELSCRPYGMPHGRVITSTGKDRNVILGKPVLKWRKCRRVMPDFPQTNDHRWTRLEEHQSHTCSRLKPGNICPHRGIDLTPFEQPDGTAICPGHGLRWNLKTGELMPRFIVRSTP